MNALFESSKEQFANSPDLKDALLHASMDALDVHTSIGAQALAPERVRDGLRGILLVPVQLSQRYEALRTKQTDTRPT